MSWFESPSGTLCLLAVLVFVYYWYTVIYRHLWRRLGVPYLTSLPFLGTDFRHSLGWKTTVDSQKEMYRECKGRPFIGTYVTRFPVLFVSDPRLIEEMMVNHFSNFHDRGRSLVIDKEADPFTDNLINADGEEWKSLRSKLATIFSSGKLKNMLSLIEECGDSLVDTIQEYAESSRPVDVREILARFGTDVIASCAFGLKVNTLQEPDSEFRRMGKRTMSLSAVNRIRAMIMGLMPWFKIFKVKFTPPDVEEFFMGLIKRTINMRETLKIERNDFVQLLMNLRKQELLEENKNNSVALTENQLAANTLVFFTAGFETTSSAITYCLFELAKNPDIQARLRRDIREALEKNNGEYSYEVLKNISYLNQVMKETLRKHPPAPRLGRICTKDFKMPGTDLVLPKGSKVDFPVYCLHHDKEYFPEPEKFRPERFSEENASNIPKGAYIPFGGGPRVCIGQRFAEMEMRLALAKLLVNFNIAKHPSVPDVLTWKKGTVLLVPNETIFLQFTQISDDE